MRVRIPGASNGLPVCAFVAKISNIDTYSVVFLAFKRDCTARFVVKGDEAVAASDYDEAIKLYSSAIGLDSSPDFSLFAHRSKANLGRNLCAEALADAEKV